MSSFFTFFNALREINETLVNKKLAKLALIVSKFLF